jgi:hypothetical protein
VRWPALSGLEVSFRGNFAYVKGVGDDGAFPLCRLGYESSANRWAFAVYLASSDRYERAVLPTGLLGGSPEDALDCACALHVDDEEAWRYGTDAEGRRAPLFSRAQLAGLFELETFKRGQDLADAVTDQFEDEWSVIGIVKDGDKSFCAMVHHGDGPLSTECDCPDGRTHICCAHVAAVGLDYIGDR